MGKLECLLLFIFLVPRSTYCNVSQKTLYKSAPIVDELDNILLNIAQEHTDLYTQHQACSNSLNQLKEKEYRTEEYGFSLLDQIIARYNSVRSSFALSCKYQVKVDSPRHNKVIKMKSTQPERQEPDQ